MATVQTVLGPIDTADLGNTLMHEHIRISWDGWQLDGTVRFDRAEALAEAVDRMQELKGLGISTFVDPAPMDLGRDTEFQAEVAQRSGINLICATGLYHEGHGVPAYFKLRDVEEIAEIYIKELTDGVAGTGIRPGVIKCATGAETMGEHEEKALRAAARAHSATGVPIVTHTSEGTLGPEQAALFRSEGVIPDAFVVGHCCANSDLRYHLSILEQGCYLGVDQVGLGMLMPDDVRLAIVASLVRLGYGNRLFLSQDHVSCYPGRFISLPDEVLGLLKDRRFPYLLDTFIPRLKDEHGLSQQQIDQMLRDNPRNFFESAAVVRG